MLAGVLTIPAIYLLGRQLFERSVGLVAAMLLAISPFHIYYSQWVRMYSLFILFTVLAFYCLLRTADSNNRRWWSLYVLCTVASLYTHYFSVLALFFQNVLVLLFIYIGQRPLKEWRNPVLAWVLAGALFLPWLVNSALLTERLGAASWLLAKSAPTITLITSQISAFSLGKTAGQYPRWLRLGSYLFFLGLLLIASFKLEPGQLFARLRSHQGVQISLGIFSCLC